MRKYLLLIPGLMVACMKGDVVPHFEGGNIQGNVQAPEVLSIRLDKSGAVTSLDTIKVSGTTKAKSVIVRGGLVPVMASVRSEGGGTFCVDVPIAHNSRTNLEIFALSGLKDDLLQPQQLEVSHDGNVRPPANPTCNGFAPGCGDKEICGNQIDDNCDGRTDNRDSACASTCQDDIYEDNNGIGRAPILERESYLGLVLCPGTEDWFTARVLANQALVVAVKFPIAAGNLEIEIRRPDGTVAGVAAEQQPDLKGIGLPQLPAGLYAIRIRGVNAQAGNKYDLFVKTQ